MLRITKLEESTEQVGLKIEGRLISTWLPLFQHECQKACQESTPVLLDLSQVTFVDEPGIHLLRSYAQDHRFVVQTSDFIQHLLSSTRSST